MSRRLAYSALNEEGFQDNSKSKIRQSLRLSTFVYLLASRFSILAATFEKRLKVKLQKEF